MQIFDRRHFPLNKTTSFTSGFTLVELAIVITIIGLLIGGVLKGQELLENSRVTALGRQVKSYEAALTTFRDIYKCVPGDCAAATSYVTGCTAGNNCANGGGDGKITDSGGGAEWYDYFDATEPFQAWKHMALAGLITGVDTTVARTAGANVGGRHVPATPFGGMVYIKTAADTASTLPAVGVILLLTNSPAGVYSPRLFTVPTAQKIDLKMDDGIAFSGDILAVSPGWTSGCGTTANGTTGYNVNTGGVACSLAVFMSR